jgi:WD40-like Beta Propeller Repeat
MRSPSRAVNVWAFALICAVATGLIAVSLLRARREADRETGARDAVESLSSLPAAPFVMFRHLASTTSWGRVAAVPLSAPAGPRYSSALACVRVHYAAGRGLCLTTVGPLGQAVVFDAQFLPRRTLALTGSPSRARVSSTGRWGAVTVFEQGHSYADTAFSTRTSLIDMLGDAAPVNLETFAVFDKGHQLRRADINFWGLTFAADDNRFYATLAYAGTPYLVEGDIALRETRVLMADVECPSLSPDGTRVAFKRARPLADGGGWRLWVLDLATQSAHALASETRSIDDQVEWLDAGHILYQFPSDDGNNVWVAGVDDPAPARRFLTDAWSPAVVR